MVQDNRCNSVSQTCVPATCMHTWCTWQTQQWFTAKDDDIVTQSKHQHLGACVPYNATVSGKLTSSR